MAIGLKRRLPTAMGLITVLALAGKVPEVFMVLVGGKVGGAYDAGIIMLTVYEFSKLHAGILQSLFPEHKTTVQEFIPWVVNLSFCLLYNAPVIYLVNSPRVRDA